MNATPTAKRAPAIARRRRLHDWLLAQPEPVTIREVAAAAGSSQESARAALHALEVADLVVCHTERRRDPQGRLAATTVWHGVHRLPTDLVPLRASLAPATDLLLVGATAAEVARACRVTVSRATTDLHDMRRAGYVELDGETWRATPDGGTP